MLDIKTEWNHNGHQARYARLAPLAKVRRTAVSLDFAIDDDAIAHANAQKPYPWAMWAVKYEGFVVSVVDFKNSQKVLRPWFAKQRDIAGRLSNVVK